MSTETEAAPAPSKADLIKKIGATLAEKRKLRGLTHEKVGQSLKFRASFVKALEEGNWQELPGEVYARGYVIRYAAMLGLNGKELLAPYLQSEAVESVQPKTISQNKPAPELPKSVWIWVGVAAVFVFGLIKVIVTDHKKAHQITPPEAVAKPVVSTAAVAAMMPAHATGQDHTLNLFSPFPLWLSVKADNRAFEGFIPQGTTWSWKAVGTFQIRIGHTQQLSMDFDGAPVTLAENQKRLTLPAPQ